MKELTAAIDIGRIQRDLVYDIDADQSQDWILELLKELNENSSLDETEYLPKSTLNITGSLKKINVPTFQDVGLLTYKFSAKYLTQSVQDLKIIEQELEYEASLCFIHENFQNDEAYKEETELYLAGQMYELYFMKKGKASVKEAVHEQTFLNFNFYPKSE